MATEMRRLGHRVGTVTAKVEIQWPIYAEHVDFMRSGSILILQIRMMEQVEKAAKAQILEQLRAIAHADGWTPEQMRDRFISCEAPATPFDELRKALGSDIGSGGGLCAILTGIEQIKDQRDAAQERVDLDIDEFRRILSELDRLRVSIPLTPESGKVLYDLVDAIVLRATNAGRQRVPLIAQRDRAESELAAERRMRVEAEAASDRLMAERDALKAKLAALVNSSRSAETILGNMAKETGRTFGRWEIHHEPLRNDAQRMLPSFRAAIAAASGGAS